MKYLVSFVLLAVAGIAQASPVNQVKDPRWALIPNSEGQMVLADLQAVQDPEPLFVPANDMFFVLYTRSHPVNGQRIEMTAASLAASSFNPNHPVRFLTHGWMGSIVSRSINLPKDAYLSIGDFNCIAVDWDVGAATINYITARNRVGEVGAFIARFIDFLHEQTNNPFSQLTVIGHSLGAHVAGFAGKHVTRGRIQTIIGLDQAGPLFSVGSPEGRMDITDAVYTEGIITNGGTLGFMEPILHATFYPNGGSSQPGCGIDVSGQCAHDRTFLFFAESITNSNSFQAIRCASFAQITGNNCVSTGAGRRLGGEPSNGPGTEGVFFLTTRDAAPFTF